MINSWQVSRKEVKPARCREVLLHFVVGSFSTELPSVWGWHTDFFPMFFFSFRLNILQLWGHPQLTVRVLKNNVTLSLFSKLALFQGCLYCPLLFLTVSNKWDVLRQRLARQAGSSGAVFCLCCLPEPCHCHDVSVSALGLSQRGQAQRTQQMEAEVLTKDSWGLSPKHQALHWETPRLPPVRSQAFAEVASLLTPLMHQKFEVSIFLTC